MKEAQTALRKFWDDEDGLGTLEIILIIAVIVIIAIIFKDWIVGFIKDIFGKVDNQKDKILETPGK